MKILNPTDPVRTAHRVRQLATTYPVECAQALAAQPEAIPMVGPALKELAHDLEAAYILSEALKSDRQLQKSAFQFYDEERRLSKPLPRQWSEGLKAIALGQMIGSILADLQPA